MHVEPLAVGGQNESLRGAADVLDAGDELAGVGVAHVDGVAALQRRERVVPERAHRGREGHVPVVEVDARCEVFLAGDEVHLRDDRAHRALECQRQAVAVGAALHVVLLAGDPGALAVRRDGDRAEVVGYAAAAVLGVRSEVDGERRHAGERERLRRQSADLAGGARDEPRHQDCLGVRGHREALGLGADR